MSYLVACRSLKKSLDADFPKDMGKQTSGNDTGAFTDFHLPRRGRWHGGQIFFVFKTGRF
jgi:hypothetical protein